MCKFVSLVVTRSGKVYGDGSFDGHSDLIKQNIKDNPELEEKHNREFSENENLKNQSFALVEITPKDGDIFNHKTNNWKLNIDQSIAPGWWSDKYEKLCFKRLKEIFKTQFIIGGEIEELDKDVRFIKNATIKILRGEVGSMSDSSKVGSMYGSSEVGSMSDSSKVGSMSDSSKVGSMYGSSKVGSMSGSSEVGYMYGSSEVGEAKDDTTINVWSKDAIVQKQIGGRTVVIKRYLKRVKVVIG